MRLLSHFCLKSRMDIGLYRFENLIPRAVTVICYLLLVVNPGVKPLLLERGDQLTNMRSVTRLHDHIHLGVLR
jgi:hypothetical protein